MLVVLPRVEDGADEEVDGELQEGEEGSIGDEVEDVDLVAEEGSVEAEERLVEARSVGEGDGSDVFICSTLIRV